MIRETFPVGMLQCNCTVLGDDSTGMATVVDPGAEIARILAVLARHQLHLQQIVVTHAHIDHIAGALALKEATGAPVLYSEADLPLVAMMEVQAGWLGVATPTVEPPDHTPSQGERVMTGTLAAEVLQTPGHTEGSLCLYVPQESLLLAGDTLFAGSVGRTDLPGGDHRRLLTSIHEHILPLPEDTVVIPGHGPATTVGAERESNPFLR